MTGDKHDQDNTQPLLSQFAPRKKNRGGGEGGVYSKEALLSNFGRMKFHEYFYQDLSQTVLFSQLFDIEMTETGTFISNQSVLEETVPRRKC